MLARLGTHGRTPIHILNEMIEGKGVCVGGGGVGVVGTWRSLLKKERTSERLKMEESSDRRRGSSWNICDE
jgi:hypothetical protein